jgi:glycerol kinase
MRTQTPGILCDRSGERTVNKQYKGEHVFARLGKVSQDSAEVWLRARQAEVDAEREQTREHEL